MRRVLAVVASLLVASGCATNSTVSGERRNIGNVTVTFTIVPAKAKAGQTVRLTIRLVNNGGTEALLTFPSAQKYDFWVTDKGREVWRWSSGHVFAQELVKQPIGGQTGAVFAESWTSGSPGTFVAHAKLTARTYDGDMTGSLVVG
jgi:hypothetical protein